MENIKEYRRRICPLLNPGYYKPLASHVTAPLTVKQCKELETILKERKIMPGRGMTALFDASPACNSIAGVDPRIAAAFS